MSNEDEYLPCLDRIKKAIDHGYTVDIETGEIYGLRNQKLKAQISTSGYLVVTLQTPGFHRNESVLGLHKLVTYLMYGDEAFKVGVEIRHLDSNKLNNNWRNLIPGTRSENIADIPKQYYKEISFKRTRHLIGKPNINRKLTDQEVNYIRNRSSRPIRGYIKALANLYKVSHSTISNIIHRRSYVSG